MSKEKIEKHIVSAQKQQIKIKERSFKCVPGAINLQILGSGANGAPASVYLFTDQSRYLFNCGEGTQRLAHEHKTKLTRLEHIFLTRTSWKRIGGLPGLSLTIQDAGVPKITLHGPPKLDQLFQSTRNFVILKQLQVEAPECEDGDFYEDIVLRIDYVMLRKHSVNGVTLNMESVMAFVCRCKPRPGTLSLKKCIDRGVPKGPLLGKLKNGESVTLENGTTVHPREVCEPDDPGPIFIVLDIPSIEYMQSLREATQIIELQNENLPIEQQPSLVLHFASADVVATAEYRDFASKFPKATKHLILNETNEFSGYVAAHRIQWQLNLINENVFPILREPPRRDDEHESEICRKRMRKLEEDSSKTNCNSSSQEESIHFEPTTSMTCFHLRPARGLDRSIETFVNSTEYLNEKLQLEGMSDALTSLKHQPVTENLEDCDSEFPKIVFLGTGSCIPNKTRNVSSILVHTNEDACVLLDAGEGTCGQLIRFYGIEAENVIRKIKGIYISHLHADHHLGLIEILQRRKILLKENHSPIILMAPIQIESWLNIYDSEFESIRSEFIFISNRNLMDNDLPFDESNVLGVKTLRTCLVPHCANSFGVSFIVDQTKPFKLTYSGDSMPCDSLVKLGASSTLLIHEATMEDELAEDAIAKMHSTVSQAIEQGHKMNAENILLTHFSQRYAKIPRIEQNLLSNVGIAFDNMHVTPSDLRHLSRYYDVLKLMFAEDWDEMEQKSLKRARRVQTETT